MIEPRPQGSGRIPGERESINSTHYASRDLAVVRLERRETDRFKLMQKSADCTLEDDCRHVLTETLVAAVAEGEMMIGAPTDVQGVWVVKCGRISVRRCGQCDNTRALWDCELTKVNVRDGNSRGDDVGDGQVAKQLADGIWKQRPVAP